MLEYAQDFVGLEPQIPAELAAVPAAKEFLHLVPISQVIY